MCNIEVFKTIIDEISRKAKEGRNLEYPEGSIGVTSLIYCPLKARFREEHPEIEADSLEIDDGFYFEKEVKEALLSLWGAKRVRLEEELPYKSDKGLKINGHLDIAIIGKKKVIGLELKNMKLAYHNLPYDSVPEEAKFIADPELIKRISIPENYMLQAKIQKYLLEQKYSPKPVEHYLFIKTMVKLNGSGLKKVFIIRKTEENITREELETLIEKFMEDETPRYPWECGFCPYRKAGICEGMENTETLKVPTEELPEPVQEALNEYLLLNLRIKDLEDYLKKELKGRKVEVTNGNGRPKTIGYMEKTKYDWDLQKVFQLLGDNILDYVTVNWRKREDLEMVLAERVALSEVRTTRRVLEWKGLN